MEINRSGLAELKTQVDKQRVRYFSANFDPVEDPVGGNNEGNKNGSALAKRSIAIGSAVVSEGANRGIAIGADTHVDTLGKNSVAIGSRSYANEADVVSVGNDAYEYAGRQYAEQKRRIIHVAKGTKDTDAVNVSQLKEKADKTDLETINQNITNITKSDGLLAGKADLNAGNLTKEEDKKAWKRALGINEDSTSVMSSWKLKAQGVTGEEKITDGNEVTFGVAQADKGLTVNRNGKTITYGIDTDKLIDNINSFTTKKITNIDASNIDLSNNTTVQNLKTKYFSVNPKDTDLAKPADDIDNSNNDGAWATKSIAIGPKARANQDASMAIGYGAETVESGSYGMAIGYGAKSLGQDALASGYQAMSGNTGVAIGSNAKAAMRERQVNGKAVYEAYEDAAVAVGNNAYARRSGSIAVGANSLANRWSIAVGQYSRSFGEESTAIGNMSHAYGDSSFAGGKRSGAYGGGSVALGVQAKVGEAPITEDEFNKLKTAGTAMLADEFDKKRLAEELTPEDIEKYQGHLYVEEREGGTTLYRRIEDPSGNMVSYMKGVAIGAQTTVEGKQSVAIGAGAAAKGANSVTIGTGSKVEGTYSVATGYVANASGDMSVAMGIQSNTSGKGAVAVGAKAAANGKYGAALGAFAGASALDSTALGSSATATTNGGVALGANTVANVAAGRLGYAFAADGATLEQTIEAAGQKEKYDKLNAVVNPLKAEYDGLVAAHQNAPSKSAEETQAKQALDAWTQNHGDFVKALAEKTQLESAWQSGAGAVSVGNAAKGVTRQITNLAAGTQDTDAVNVAQLKVVNKKADDNATAITNITKTDGLLSKKADIDAKNVEGDDLKAWQEKLGIRKAGDTNYTDVHTSITNINKQLGQGFKLKSGDAETTVALNGATAPTIEFAGDSNISAKLEGKKVTYSLNKTGLTTTLGDTFAKQDASNITGDNVNKWKTALGIDNLGTGTMSSWKLKATSDATDTEAETIENGNEVTFGVSTETGETGLKVTRKGTAITYGIDKDKLVTNIAGDIINQINNTTTTTTPITNISAKFSVQGDANPIELTLKKDQTPNVKFEGEADKIDVTVAQDGTGAKVTVKTNAKLGENIDISNNSSITNITKTDGLLSKKADIDAKNVEGDDLKAWQEKLGIRKAGDTNYTDVHTSITNINKQLGQGFKLKSGDAETTVALNGATAPTIEFAGDSNISAKLEGKKVTYSLNKTGLTTTLGDTFAKQDASNITGDNVNKWKTALGIDNLGTGTMSSWKLKASTDTEAETIADGNEVAFGVSTETGETGLKVTRKGAAITYGIDKGKLVTNIAGDIINRINDTTTTTTPITNISAKFSVQGDANPIELTLTKEQTPNVKFEGETDKIDVTVAQDGTGAKVTVKTNAKLGENIDISNNSSITNITKTDGLLSKKADIDAKNVEGDNLKAWQEKLGIRKAGDTDYTDVHTSITNINNDIANLKGGFTIQDANTTVGKADVTLGDTTKNAIIFKAATETTAGATSALTAKVADDKSVTYTLNTTKLKEDLGINNLGTGTMSSWKLKASSDEAGTAAEEIKNGNEVAFGVSDKEKEKGLTVTRTGKTITYGINHSELVANIAGDIITEINKPESTKITNVDWSKWPGMEFFKGGTMAEGKYVPSTVAGNTWTNSRIVFGNGLTAKEIQDEKGNKYTEITVTGAGTPGTPGAPGENGKSAFDIWKEENNNPNATKQDFLDSLKGTNGQDGKSVYDTWKEQPGNDTKTKDDFLKEMKGEKGADGTDGNDGKSVYDTWKETTTETDKSEANFLKAMKGEDGTNGKDGKSAYQVWKEYKKADGTKPNENKSEADFMDYMKGKGGAGGTDFTVKTDETATDAKKDTKVDTTNPSFTIAGDKTNITTSIGGNNTVKVALKKDITVDSVTAGGVKIDKNGIDAGGKKVTNIKAGDVSKDSTDAVTGGQLFETNQTVAAINQTVGKLGGAIADVRNESREGDALNAALAALKPLDFDPLQRSQIMAGVSTYKGKQAVALGLAHYSNEDTLVHAGVSYAGSSELMANAGISWRFGDKADREAKDARNNRLPQYAAGPMSSVYIMQDEVATLQAKNNAAEARIAELEAENKASDERIAALEKQMQALLNR